MDWIDRVNRYLLDAIAQRRARGRAPSSPTLLRMSPALVDQLARLDLASHPGFVGETWVLWGALVDGTPTAISETDPGWQAMRSALEQSGRLNVALHETELRFMADPHRHPLCLFSDAKAPPSDVDADTARPPQSYAPAACPFSIPFPEGLRPRVGVVCTRRLLFFVFAFLMRVDL